MNIIQLTRRLGVFLMYGLLFLFNQLHSQEYFIANNYFIKDICTCDIDIDGDNDLVISSSGNGSPDSLYIFYNDGIGNLLKSSIRRNNGIFVKCGYIDDDNFPDIITKDGSNILCIRNNGDGTFSEEIIIAPSQSYRIINYIEDMDGDGWNDLVYTYSLMYRKWGILKNEGNISFTDHIVYDDGLGGNINYFSLGTLNDDNLPDISLVFTTDGIHALMNNGDLTFDSLLLCPTRSSCHICKLDATNPEDILVLSKNTSEFLLYQNFGDNIFINKNILPLRDALIMTDIADFNNDGYDDLCYSVCWWTGCTDSIYISINDEHWSFAEPQQYYVGLMELFSTETSDINGDGFIDIMLFGYSPSNAFKILWNDGSGGFTYENPVGIKSPELNNDFTVTVSPNPFSSNINISLTAKKRSQLDVSIVDLFGKSVKVFKSTSIEKDENMEMNWDGKDDSGNHVKNGIYFLQISLNQKAILVKKIVKLN